MSFKDAVATCLTKKYAKFSSRASQSELWYFYLFCIAVVFVLTIIDMIVFGFQALSMIFTLAMILPSIAVSVRRLHDIDKSGWFYLLVLIPIVGLILLYWFCLRGTAGDNRFGADPLTSQMI